MINYKFKQVMINSLTITIVIIAINILASNDVLAGQDGAQLKEAHAALGNIIGGYGGKLVALTSLGVGLVGSVLRFNPYAIVGCFGTCLAASLGVSVINNTVTALI